MAWQPTSMLHQQLDSAEHGDTNVARRAAKLFEHFRLKYDI